MKRIFFVFLILAACGQGIRTPPDTLVVGLEAQPKTPHDPRLSMSDAYSSKIASLVFNGLFRINERMEVVPDLVESYRLIPPLTYQFRLRKGIRFHNGSPFRAEDVKKTIEAILDPKTASPHRGVLSLIETIRVTDPLNLEIKLKTPFAPILSALTFGILPEGNGVGVGTGPYQFEGSVAADRVVLSRNDYFINLPRMPKLEFRVIPDDNVRVLELISGSIDFLQNNIPPPLIASLKRRTDLSIATTGGINVSYLGMNLKSPPLKDQRVREAMLRAIDRRAVIAYRLAGFAEPASGILSPLHWAYEGEVADYPYDPAKAKGLLDEAGYLDPDGAGPRPRFTLSYKTSTRRDRIALARLIARYLKTVGIDIRLLPYEWGTFFHDIQTGNFQLYSLTWVGISDPDIFHFIFHSSQVPPQGANRGGFNNPVIDRLTEEGRHVGERNRRKEYYSMVQKILAEELPYLTLWYENNVAIFQKNVKGVRLRPDAGFEVLTEIYKEP